MVLEIGEAIRQGLQQKRMSQREFAKRIGESDAVVSSWITGKSVPPGDKVLTIIRTLSLEKLLFDHVETIGNLDIIQQQLTLSLHGLIRMMRDIDKRLQEIEAKCTCGNCMCKNGKTEEEKSK